MSRRWPEHLWIVRHGQSAGNVARDAADAAGLAVIDIAERDVDVPLSALGEDQAEARARSGKFYYRPPGGESWCDVILRLRSVLDTLSLHHAEPGSRVLVVAHQVIVLCLRYLIEGMSEEEILAIDRAGDVANC